MHTLALATDEGDMEIHEDELSWISDAELREFEISREELRRLFAEGVKLMQSTGENPVRPRASQTLDGKWEVYLVRHSPLSEPLLRRRS
jgi:hypothetical protein